MTNPDEFRIKDLHSIISNKISENLRLLLETKHLYQSLSIDWHPIVDQAKLEQEQIKKEAQKAIAAMMASGSSRILMGQQTEHNDDMESYVMKQLLYFIRAPWEFMQCKDRRPPSPLPGKKMFEAVINLPTIKLFCNNCERKEPYKPVYGEDALPHFCQHPDYLYETDNTEQIFVLSYQCQSCDSKPEIFLVRRFIDKLTIAGRSMIEHVEVPKVIPKEVAKYWSNAIVAFQSGQVLAGLFFLRVLIEQQGQIVSKGQSLKGDKAIEFYMSTLLDEVKEKFPSFVKIYEELSYAIHTADENEKLFYSCLDDIEAHYQAKQLYYNLEKKKKPKGI